MKYWAESSITETLVKTQAQPWALPMRSTWWKHAVLSEQKGKQQEVELLLNSQAGFIDMASFVTQAWEWLAFCEYTEGLEWSHVDDHLSCI